MRTVTRPHRDHHVLTDQAAFRARVVYPGPVRQLVCRELLTWSTFGRRLGGEGFVMQVVDEVLGHNG